MNSLFVIKVIREQQLLLVGQGIHRNLLQPRHPIDDRKYISLQSLLEFNVDLFQHHSQNTITDLVLINHLIQITIR